MKLIVEFEYFEDIPESPQEIIDAINAKLDGVAKMTLRGTTTELESRFANALDKLGMNYVYSGVEFTGDGESFIHGAGGKK